ncbi:MAG: pilin [Minisyncoccia bacterium]|jgi:hypothetical protein
MSIIKKSASVIVGFFAFTFSFLIAFAQNNSAPPLTNPLAVNGSNPTFQTILSNVTSFLLLIAAPICGIMVVWGGFQMITARGNPEKFSEGKKTLLYAAVGFIVIIFASSVVPLIQSIFTGS